ncbi:MAG: Unknown protein [uncultured Sulfurovum sp.]|uniref:OmpA-like domain-containing protein n=1 Tax=uncultured Sulfurovum sp. TaxID=269237 RepID=A0A6S6TEY7_9BACT|nr:MAG: Unknown protein [uncultured Sulfurovum sp.]
MKFGQVLFLFFFSAILLIFLAIQQNAQPIYNHSVEKERLRNIQTTYVKTYYRSKKNYISKQSLHLAQMKINNILGQKPINFETNGVRLLANSTLIEIVKIVNRVKEDVILSITAHTGIVGSKKDNLKLSQKRADRLKEYFLKRTHLPLIVAIGYGEAFSLKDKKIEVNLKRIKR